MGKTSTDVANDALMLIDGKSVLNISSDDKAAKICKRMLPIARKSLLGRADWSCMRRIAELSNTGNTPIDQWAYEHELPGALIKLRAISTKNYELRNGKLYTNASTVKIKYTEDVVGDNYSVLDDTLYEALVLLVAKRIVIPLTGKHNKYLSIKQEYDEALNDALFENSVEDGSEYPVGYNDIDLHMHSSVSETVPLLADHDEVE